MSDQTPTISPNPSTPSPPVLTLQNEITIRRWRLSDAEALSHHANNRKIWLNLTDRFPHPYTLSDATAWINSCNDPSNFLPTYNHNSSKDDGEENSSSPTVPRDYAICHRDTAIGGIGLEREALHPRSLALGYWLGESHWGRGIVTTAAGAFLTWAFETFPWCVRVGATVYGWNPGSMRVLSKIGMQLEGRQRAHVWKAGQFCDLVLFGTVRSEAVPGDDDDDSAGQGG